MNPTPGLPPEFLHRNLEEIARKDHGDEGGGKQNSRPAVLPVTILDALPSVPLPNHPGSEDEDGSGENVEVLEVVLEGMDSRPEFIRRNLGKPKGPEISQASGSHQEGGYVVEEGLSPAHWPERTACRARERREE